MAHPQEDLAVDLAVKCETTQYRHNWYDYFSNEFWAKFVGDFLDDKNGSKVRM